MNRRIQKSKKTFENMQGFMLLEVLVSILIFSCGMLAMVGLQAKSFKDSGDVQYRAEAIHMANAYVGKIKAMTPAAVMGGAGQVASLFDSGSEYHLFEKEVKAKLPGAGSPVVRFMAVTGIPEVTRLVEITLTWQSPGENVTRRHTQTSVIGNN